MTSTPRSEPESPPVELAVFTGPLDLLLHLIQKDELSIYDIPIVRICDQYHEYLRAMTELDLELAGEFLWMASWLLHLKSKTLLPKIAESEEDPRLELVERLLEYRRVKELAALLYDLDVVRRGVWQTDVLTELEPEEVEIDLEDLDLRQLAITYLEVMQRHAAAHPPPLQLIPLRFSVEQKMRDLYSAVRGEGLYPLLRNLKGGPDAEEMVVLFVAALELVRLGGVRAEQRRPFAEIYLRPSRRELDPESFFSRRETTGGS